MLTAAVRDLHRAAPGRFITDIRTPHPSLWENNRYLTPLGEREADVVECHYPLIHRANSGPWHFIHGFQQYLNEQLGVRMQPTEFKGDIHLSLSEKAKKSQVEESLGCPVPFWIVVSGGKHDFTAKWWDPARMQAVVDHFRGRVLFVQVGEAAHHHPALHGVLDLRGKTTLRQFVVLMYHAQGVICPVTLAMHLAAAVETRRRCAAYPRGMPKQRPCVVIAGGREPAQWEAYPFHQYIHTIGALDCCATGGCWKSRVVALRDGDEKDRSLCARVVRMDEYGKRLPGKEMHGAQFVAKDGTRALPRCLEMISAAEVIRRVEWYFEGGTVSYLDEGKAREIAHLPNSE